jgi:chorismate mutase
LRIGIKEHIFNIKNVGAFADRVRKRLHTDQTEVKSLEKRLASIQRQIDKIIKLYRLDTIDIDDIEAELVPLLKKKKAVSEHIEKIKSSQGVCDVSDAEILDIIGRLDEEFSHADPNIRKRVCTTLFEEIRIFPKQGNPWNWERLLEIKGVQMPLTRVNVVIPGGIEPPLPA